MHPLWSGNLNSILHALTGEVIANGLVHSNCSHFELGLFGERGDVQRFCEATCNIGIIHSFLHSFVCAYW